MKSNFKTDIILGEVYEHRHSNIRGTAMAVYFYLYGCERVAIMPENFTDNQ